MIYLDDRPIASFPSAINEAIEEGIARRTLIRYSLMFPGRAVRCAVRTDEGHLLVGQEGILLDEEVTV